MPNMQKYSHSVFESIKHINEYGQEFWYARELAKLSNIRIFATLSKVFSKHSGYNISDHFGDANKMALVNFVKNFSKIP